LQSAVIDLQRIINSKNCSFVQMSVPPQQPQNLAQVVSKPNRAAIIRAIGDQGELSFKDLKAKMNLGVGTLYYHLDGLTGLVTQNGAKQYILTEQGRKVYDALKDVPPLREQRRIRIPSIRATLGEILLFDSHVSRLSIDAMSNISITFGILLTASVLAGMTRVEDGVFFILGRSPAPSFAFFTVPLSWALLFGMGAIIIKLLWRSSLSLPGLAGGSALAQVPVMFAMVLEGLRRTFTPWLAALNLLYTGPTYLVFQGIVVVWGAYIYTISVRSASNLNLEKTLVVALLIVLINLGYLWGRPLLLPVH